MFGKLFGKRERPEPSPDESWTVGTTEAGGQPLIVRSLSRMPAAADRADFSHLVEIAWPYVSASSTGFPTDADQADMAEFEDALEIPLSRSANGWHALTFTGAGEKRWMYYTPEPGAFAATLSASLAGHKVYPIQLVAREDPDWGALDDVLASFARAGRGVD